MLKARAYQDTVPNHEEIGNRQTVIYLPFESVVVVEVDSWVLVVDGAGTGAGVVTLLVVVEVDVDSFSLLQPANNAKVTKPIAIISLVFIVVSYRYKFC